MTNQKFQKVVKVKRQVSMRVINCTNREIWTYTNEGSLMHIPEGKGQEGEIPAPSDNVCVIVDRSTYEKLRKFGRATSDLACAVGAGTSYDRKSLTDLYRYDDHVRIMPPERLV